MPTALITGATAGIGAEFARQLAARHCDLVLVARDRPRLERAADALTREFGVDVEVLAADLLSPDGLAAVESRVRQAAGQGGAGAVDYLVNNAGFGLAKAFDASSIEDEQRLLDLLVAVPMRLAHAALAQMLPRRTGTIINIASVAGFIPAGTYSAAKAWMLSFSRWANIAYKRRGITVTAVAPGFVRTEFHERMNVEVDRVPRMLWLQPERLVRLALRDVDRGRAISVPTGRYKALVALTKVLPARALAAEALPER